MCISSHSLVAEWQLRLHHWCVSSLDELKKRVYIGFYGLEAFICSYNAVVLFGTAAVHCFEEGKYSVFSWVRKAIEWFGLMTL